MLLLFSFLRKHLDWFSSIFMYKLRFLATVSVIRDFLLSISPLRYFFSYHLTTQASFSLLFSFLDLHQTDCSKTANQVCLSPALSNSTSLCTSHLPLLHKRCELLQSNFSLPFKGSLSQILNSSPAEGHASHFISSTQPCHLSQISAAVSVGTQFDGKKQ